MADYFRSVLLVSVVTALASLLLPEKEGRLRRVCEFGLALLALSVICRPISALRDALPLRDGWQSDFFDASGQSDDGSETARRIWEDTASLAVRDDLCAKFSLQDSDLCVSCTLTRTGDTFAFSSLTVRVSGAARLSDLYAVKAYADRTYGCETEVVPDGG